MTSSEVSTVPTEAEEKEEQKSIRCKACGFEITSPDFAIQPHEHTFRNPHGYSFHVLRFSDAPGAGDVGDPVDEATWFPGFAWTFAVCKQCREHLGWWYTGTGRFVGLIAQRLLR